MVHPEVEKAYREAGLDYEKNTNDIIQMAFEEIIKDPKTKQPKETDKRINSIYRVRVGGNKEYLLYFVTEYQVDHLGNRHDWTHLEGKYKHPVFSNRFNQATGNPEASGLLDTETRYTIPYEGPESVDAILRKGNITFETQFYLDTGYGVFANYSLEEFKHKSFYELEQKGITGKYPRQEEIDRQKQVIRNIPDPITTTTTSSSTTTAAESLSATTDPKLAAEIERWQERSRGEAAAAAAESTPKISSDSPNSKMALGENVVVKLERKEEKEEAGEGGEAEDETSQQTLRQRQQLDRQRRRKVGAASRQQRKI